MPSQLANNIVLACETQDAEGLCSDVYEALSMKAVEYLEQERRFIASTILEDIDQPDSKCRDPYDLYREPVKEAIDKVVESMTENMDLSLTEAIKEAIKDKENVTEDEILEYFSDLGTPAVKTISTKETGCKNDNADRMGDEDETKVIQFESIVSELNKYKASSAKEMVLHLYENLNPENRSKMVETLKESKEGFISVLNLAQKVKDGN